MKFSLATLALFILATVANAQLLLFDFETTIETPLSGFSPSINTLSTSPDPSLTVAGDVTMVAGGPAIAGRSPQFNFASSVTGAEAITLQFSPGSINGFTLVFDYSRNNKGPVSGMVSISVDGIPLAPTMLTFANNASTNTSTVDLSPLNAALLTSDPSSVSISIGSFSGQTDRGVLVFDNVTLGTAISEVPEPSTYLAGFSMIGLALYQGRLRIARRNHRKAVVHKA